MRAWKPYRHSALHHSHVDLGATMVERDGWQQPATYGTEERELATLRESVGLCDVSAHGKLLLQGDGLDATLREAFEAEGVPEVGRVPLNRPPDDSGGRDGGERQAGLRHDARFEPVARTHVEHLDAAPPGFFGQRQGRVDVSPGSTS